jgi:general secretion pathway protein C
VTQALRLDGELASRLIGLAPRVLTGLLIVLLGIRAAMLVAAVASPPVSDAGVGLPPPAASRNVVDVPSILRANLFGQSAAGTGNGPAPVTSLPLLLAGVIADTNEARGFAMVGTGSQDIKFYKVGDVLPGGARLHGVQVDRVLLDRGGAVEALLLPPRTSLALGTAAPVAPAPAASVERVQQLIRENPGILGQVIQRQAVFADGKLRGMRVYPGPNAVAFSRLGLRPGDLVVAINGSRLDDQTRSNEVFGTLANSAEAHITVTRNGTEQDLLLNLAEIANEAEQLVQPQTGEVPPPGAEPPPTGTRPGGESTR